MQLDLNYLMKRTAIHTDLIFLLMKLLDSRNSFSFRKRGRFVLNPAIKGPASSYYLLMPTGLLASSIFILFKNSLMEVINATIYLLRMRI